MNTKGTSSEVPFLFRGECILSILEQSLWQLVAESPLWQPHTKVIAACSGGADSLCLTDVMASRGAEDDVQVIVVHVQHHLRGEEAEQDAAAVEDYCNARGLRFIRRDVEPRKLAAQQGMSLEDAARKLRYEVLEQCRQQESACGIFLAHHMDDQAETVLLNLLRGTGTRGLRGMLPVNGYLARPFLSVSRRDTEAYCEEMGLAYVTDSTNEDLSIKRNWVRLKLLPLLATRNPRIKKQLAQAASLAASDEAYLEKQARRYIAAYGRDVFGTFDIKVEKDFQNLPLCLRSRVIRILVREAGGQELSFDHVHNVLAMIDKGVGNKALDVPGQVRLIYLNGRLMVGRNERSRQEEREAKLAQKELQRHASKA